MHSMGLHSALAIKRQRKRRDEQKRARERRYSIQSTDSGLTSPHNSTGSLERHGSRRPRRTLGHTADIGVGTSIGMLHVGIVFLVLGMFLAGSGLLPDDLTSWSSIGKLGWFNELVFAGMFSFAIGVFLIILNKYLSKREEDNLEEYVQRQLTRSRSGHRLERDAETGGMLTKHHKRAKKLALEGQERGLDAYTPDDNQEPVPPSPGLTKTPPNNDESHGFVNMLVQNGDVPRDAHLEQIIEEDYSTSDKQSDLEGFNKDTYSFNSTLPEVHGQDYSGRHMIMSRM